MILSFLNGILTSGVLGTKCPSIKIGLILDFEQKKVMFSPRTQVASALSSIFSFDKIKYVLKKLTFKGDELILIRTKVRVDLVKYRKFIQCHTWDKFLWGIVG